LLMTNTQIPWPWLCTSLALALVTARVKRTRWKVLSVGLSCAVLSGAPVPSIAPQPPRIAFLDVGQGDAILIQGREATVLVDAGNSFFTGGSMGEFAVLPALRAMKVSQLDLLVASHADQDHQGGLAAVLRGVRVGALWLPYGGMNDPAFAALRKTAHEEKVPMEERGAGGMTETMGDLRIETLWPPRQNSTHTRNNRSLVLRVELAGLTLLLPGDLERDGERELLRSGRSLKADWLKLGHHGSQTSSTPAFLRAVDAEHALVSVPCSGRFDMPHASVVQRLTDEGIQMWWTGRDGAVLVGATGEVSTWRGASASCPGRGNL
jgi:competence protein ComEC